MADSRQFDKIPEFNGDVAKYRDWKRAVLIYHASATTEKRKLTAPKVLAALRGDAQLSTRHMDPETLRSQGEEGLRVLLEALDRSYQWQPESLLYEALETFLYFPSRRNHESITAYLARYHTALAQFTEMVNDHRAAEARARHTKLVEATRATQMDWLTFNALSR